MTKPHTKEPWRTDPNQPDNIERVFYEGCLRDSWCRDPICSEADAARIVACVNACAGMDDPAAEIEQLRTALLRIAKPERFYLSEQFKWAQDIAMEALGLNKQAVRKIKAPLRQCRICQKTKRSWTKTIMCCGQPMGAPIEADR